MPLTPTLDNSSRIVLPPGRRPQHPCRRRPRGARELNREASEFAPPLPQGEGRGEGVNFGAFRYYTWKINESDPLILDILFISRLKMPVDETRVGQNHIDKTRLPGRTGVPGNLLDDNARRGSAANRRRSQRHRIPER